MLLSVAGRNAGVSGITALSGFVGLFSAWPGATGSVNELTGGSPAYIRKAIAWGAPAAGASISATQPVLDVPAGSTVAFVGLHSLAAAGTFYGAAPVGGGVPKPFTSQVTDIVTCESHGFADTTKVIVISTGAQAPPPELVEGTIYFVRDSTTDTFKLAATSGGAAIDLTTTGAGFVTTIVPETYAAAGTFTVAANTISLNN
jgi:hypothetical protein